MQNQKLRLVSVFGISLLLFAACSGTAASPSAGAKNATSAAEMGGVDAVCAAGKTEGQVNIIATPPDWANYGEDHHRLHREVRDQGPVR